MDLIQNQCPNALGTELPAQLFLTLIQTLVNVQCNIRPPPIKNHGPDIIDMDKFDFIVVGAGSAGSVVANRLSENPNWNVLLLEAGEEPSVASTVPALLFGLQNTDEAWRYEPETQEHSCQGFTDQKCKWYTGRALGGSSTINAMVYVRGHKNDYDNWEKHGNTGWGWENMMKYFKKSEDNIDYPDNEEYHGTKGYQKVGTYDYDMKLKDVLFEAVKEKNIPVVKDIHNGTSIHYGNAQGTVYKGQRWSTYSGYLQAAKDRPNLKIVTGAYVTKVIINPSLKKARAVEVKIGDNILRIRATKEIILSAGALKTPQILMLSGIGDKNHLDKFEIPFIHELKVGQNLQDHVFFLGLYIKSLENLVEFNSPLDEIYQYFMHRSGIFSTTGFTNVVGFINTLKDSDYPDIQFMHAIFRSQDPFALPMLLKSIGVNNEIMASLLEVNKENSLFMMWPKLLRPKSKGYIKLASRNPFDKPIMVSNYLTEDEDVETLLRSVKFALSLLETEAFAAYKPEIFEFNLPNCKEHTFKSDDYWRCSIRSLSTTVYHYSGTAKMGPDTDPDAVVSPRLRVHGIDGLRVIDVSIMPQLISGNTNAAAIAIGEKGADIIKEDWENYTEPNNKDEL